MNAIPLINNAPKFRPDVNVNVNHIGGQSFNPVSPQMGNVMRQNPASMPINNETQLRQEVNTSIVALKREAFSLENLIAQAAQTLQDVNNRLSELEGKQGDYVKKADATVAGVGGDGKYISAISETDGKINATVANLATSIASGGTTPPTSGAVYSALSGKANIETGNFSLIFLRSTVQTLSGSYVKIGSVVFANVRVKVTATTVNNDYVNLPSNVPAMDTSKGCFGSWRTNQANGYGTIQNSGTSSIWFIYNNAEYNVGQKAMDSDGTLQIELVYFT